MERHRGGLRSVWKSFGILEFQAGENGEKPKGPKGKPIKYGDPYIIHLNIALPMVGSLYFGGKSHVSNGQNVSFKEP